MFESGGWHGAAGRERGRVECKSQSRTAGGAGGVCCPKYYLGEGNSGWKGGEVERGGRLRGKGGIEAMGGLECKLYMHVEQVTAG